jgi:hypothetical protein
MAKTYRDVAIDQIVATVEEAMSHAIDWWGTLPTPMNEAIDKFRIQHGAAIDSVEFVKRVVNRTVPDSSWKATRRADASSRQRFIRSHPSRITEEHYNRASCLNAATIYAEIIRKNYDFGSN